MPEKYQPNLLPGAPSTDTKNQKATLLKTKICSLKTGNQSWQ